MRPGKAAARSTWSCANGVIAVPLATGFGNDATCPIARVAPCAGPRPNPPSDRPTRRIEPESGSGRSLCGDCGPPERLRTVRPGGPISLEGLLGRGGEDPGAGAVAGSATWFDAARGVLYLSRDADGRRRLDCLKANHGASGWSVPIRARISACGRFEGFEADSDPAPGWDRPPEQTRNYNRTKPGPKSDFKPKTTAATDGSAQYVR